MAKDVICGGVGSFRVCRFDEDSVKARGRSCRKDEPGRAAHEVAAARPHDVRDLSDLAHRRHGKREGLQRKGNCIRRLRHQVGL